MEIDFAVKELVLAVAVTFRKLADGTVDEGDLAIVDYLSEKIEAVVEQVAEDKLSNYIEKGSVQNALSLAATVLELLATKL
jgi:hypothetical protein